MHTPTQIWSALRRVQMHRVVRSKMPLGLHSDIRESGANLSVGEKQLLCLVCLPACGMWVRAAPYALAARAGHAC